jgi:ATP phosphoribosyltransferase
MVAVHAVVEEDHINALLPQLKKAGASGILVLPIERMVP